MSLYKYKCPGIWRPAAIAATLLVTVAAWPSQAADPSSHRQVQVGDRAIALPVPSGYCQIDRNDPVQDQVASQVEAASGQHVRMLTFDADCAALEAFTASGGGSITPYVIHYVVLDGDRLATYDGTRETFVQQAAREAAGPELQTRLHATAKEADVAAQRQLDELARKSQRPVTVEGTQVQEPLGHDDNAVYIGFISRFETQAGPQATAGVTGMTLIDGVVTTVNMYRDYQDQQTLQMLLKEVQSQVASVVAANGG